MTFYRTLLLGFISLFLAGCVGYDFDDNYDRSYSRGGYGVPAYGSPYGNGYSVQRYEVYSAPRYYAPAPRYYAPPPPPRYYAPQPHRRPPIYQGWNQPPRGFYLAPGRGHDRHQRHDRDDRRGNEHRNNDRGHDGRGDHGDRRHRSR